ncbi:MAG: NAD(P)-binding protein, partial [Thermotogota bacterium]
MEIAIIGAGFSGLLSAYLLEKKGHKVTVYEKEELTGGHCRTVLNKDTYFELGSVFSFNKKIKDLLVKLKVDYTERFTYRKFLNENYEAVEQISKEKIALLIKDLEQLKNILKKYSDSLNTINYGYVHDDLNVSLF